jgi:hypothetical protein
LTCPHCHGEIPHGARVCRGCQAEVEYGAPWWANIGALILGAFAWAEGVAYSPKAAIGAGIVVAIFLLFFASWAFRNRIVVKRVYRT